MIKSLVETIKNIALRHKGVGTFRYQGETFNNAQHNYKTFQVYVDTVSYHNLNITTNIFTSELQLYILGFTDDENPVIDVQNKAFTIAVDILGYIDYHLNGQVKLHDYSILTLDGYTAQRNAGVKLSLVLEVPSPLNLCELNDNFNDEPVKPEEDDELELKVIDLPITIRC